MDKNEIKNYDIDSEFPQGAITEQDRLVFAK